MFCFLCAGVFLFKPDLTSLHYSVRMHETSAISARGMVLNGARVINGDSSSLFHLTRFIPGKLYHDYIYHKCYCEYLNR